jgi:hypothetical protein
MAKRLGQYDGALQMFASPDKAEPNHNHLKFLRWLGEQDRLEHPVASQPTGELADLIYPQPQEAIAPI